MRKSATSSTIWVAAVALLASSLAVGQNTAPQASAPQAAATAPQAVAGEISGTVKSGTTPLPGVEIIATNATGQKVLTSTDTAGHYAVNVPVAGQYTVRAQFPAFAPASKQAVVSAQAANPTIDIEMQLQSRVQAAARQQLMQRMQQQVGTAAANRGFQNLGVAQSESANAAGEQGLNGVGSADAGNNGAESLPQAGLENSATESVTVAGRMGNSENQGPNLDDIMDRVQEAVRNNGGGQGGPGGGFGGGPGGGGMAGFGGGSPMMVALGGPGGGGGFGGFGGFGRFNVNKPHGSLFYTVGDPVLDAAPYSLTGVPTNKADYMSNRFGASIGGPMNIPHIYKGGDKTFYFLNYSGGRNQNPVDSFYTVPTLDQRAGNFLGTTANGAQVQIKDPQTGAAFSSFQIPQDRMSKAALGLLPYIPLPNEPGTQQNFHYIATGEQVTDAINIRIMHNFGQTQTRQQRGQRGQGGAAGGRGGLGGRGGAAGGRRGPLQPRNNLNVGFNYTRSHADTLTPSPKIIGKSQSYGLNVPITYVRSFGRLVTNSRLQFNRSRTQATGPFSNLTPIEQSLGITGVSQSAIDYGVPTLSWSHYTGLRDISPSLRRDQTWTLGEGVNWSKGKFNWRFGADFRRIQLNPRSDPNARGTFTFTGFYSGYDFADFLLGLPQQTSAQYGVNNYYFRGNSWDAYAQNDWRVRGNLTLNLGLRYEYVSPMTEKFNHIVNLDVDPLFLQTPVPVQPVAGLNAGPFNGTYPKGLVRPDRNNFAPRVGIAWRATSKTVVRTGYGLNYNTGAYSNIVQQMGFQPPFTFTQTNTVGQIQPAVRTCQQTAGGVRVPICLENGFPTLGTSTVTNNFGVDPNYRLGYVQIANFGIQQELTKTLLMNADYNWNKGTRLDIVRAPNRSANGVRIANAQPFQWWDSLGDSTTNSLSVNLRKRMQHGIQVGGNYVFSKSLDNASTIGGGGTVVAQNDLDLHAERGYSSFDVRHRMRAYWTYELPWGTNKRWLGTGSGPAGKIFGNWTMSGSLNLQGGSPFTARVVGSVQDVARGTNGTLRANYNGQPIGIPDGTIAHWFNTAAFTAPAPGTLGNSMRNMIRGPGQIGLDMSLSKQIPIRDVQGLDIRMDATNLFNHPNFTSIDTNLNSLTYGQVTGVGGMRKISLTARYRF